MGKDKLKHFRFTVAVLLALLIPTLVAGQITTLHHTIRRILVQDTAGNIVDNYILKYDAASGTMKWEVDAGGDTNADSLVHIPIQDTTGNIADNYVLAFDAGTGTLIWATGGTTNADSVKQIPIQDTTGNIADNYIPVYNAGTGTMDWEAQAGAGGGETNTLSSVGETAAGADSLTAGKSGLDLRVKSLIAGDSLVATATDSTLTLDVSGFSNYLPLAGGTLTGDINADSNLILEPYIIDMTYPGFIEETDQAAFRTYLEFGADIMYIGATNVSNARERCWDFGLAEMTALSPATIGQVKINGDVDWEGNAIAKAYIAANAIDSTKVVANSLSFSDDLRLFTIAELETQLGGTDNVLLETEIDASSELLALIDDETGSGLVVFGTSPTFTTDITSPLIIGGTGTTSDLSLKTTSGVGTTGADMHFLVGNDGATEAVTILNNGYVGIGTNAPNAPLEVKGIFQGEVGGFPSGLFHVTRGGDAEFANAVITGHNTYNTNTQLWYLGSTSSGNYNIALLNRQDGDIHFHTNDAFRMTIVSAGNVGIGTPSPPEKMSVVGNIATGDTTTGDVDVFHYFSTDGSWVTEYFKWDDGDSEFQLSDDLAVTGRVSSGDTLDYTFNLFDPDAVFAGDAEVCIDPRVADAITITRIDVTLDADPTTELTFSLKFADAFIGFANAVVVDDTATVAGVTTVTGGFGDATVPADKCLYLLIDADPDDAITQASFKVSYTVD